MPDQPYRPSVVRTPEEWRTLLTPFEFAVLREAATEPPGTGAYEKTNEPGDYACKGCGTVLFTATEKFDSHCGWPSFFSPLAGERIIELEDRSLGRVRTEVRCASCGSHLGHVFAGEGYDTPTDLRYCINSLSIRLEPEQS